jgi:hypothetical protein
MKACIYRLRCRLTEKFYIGSTTCTLACRLKKHRASSKEQRKQASPLYTHFREVGWQHAEMSVLREIEVETRRELLELEKAEILLHLGSPLCLNHNRPVITREEKKESDADYGKKRRAENKDDERQRIAEWRRNNPEKRAEQNRRSVEQQRQKRLAREQKNVAV